MIEYDDLELLKVTKKSEAIKLREFLYPSDDVVCLKRKRDIFFNVHYKKNGM